MIDIDEHGNLFDKDQLIVDKECIINRINKCRTPKELEDTIIEIYEILKN